MPTGSGARQLVFNPSVQIGTGVAQPQTGRDQRDGRISISWRALLMPGSSFRKPRQISILASVWAGRLVIRSVLEGWRAFCWSKMGSSLRVYIS